MATNSLPSIFHFQLVILLVICCSSGVVFGVKINILDPAIATTATADTESANVEKPKRSLLQHGHYTPSLSHYGGNAYGGSASKYQFFGGLNLNHYLTPAPAPYHAPVYPVAGHGHGHGHSSNAYAPVHVPSYPAVTHSSKGHGGHSGVMAHGHGHSGDYGHMMTMAYAPTGHGHGHHNPYLEEVYKLAQKAVTASHASQAISSAHHHGHGNGRHSGGGSYGNGHGHSGMGRGHGHGHGHGRGHGHGGASSGHGHGGASSGHGHAGLGHMDSYTVGNGHGASSY